MVDQANVQDLEMFEQDRKLFYRLSRVPILVALGMFAGIRVLFLNFLVILLVPVFLLLIIAGILIAIWGIVLTVKTRRLHQPIGRLVWSTLLAAVIPLSFAGFALYMSYLDSHAR